MQERTGIEGDAERCLQMDYSSSEPRRRTHFRDHSMADVDLPVMLPRLNGSFAYQENGNCTDLKCSEGLGNANFHIMNDWAVLLAGQLVSFFLACTGATQASLFLNCDLSAPAFTIGLFYSCLALFLIPTYLKAKRESDVLAAKMLDDNDYLHVMQPPQYSLFGVVPLQGPVWAYFGMAVLDFYANFFTILSFKYTTFASAVLFDALCVPTAMFISKFALSRKYQWAHYVGVAICISGMLLNVYQDFYDDRNDHENDADREYRRYPNKVRGDLFAIGGGILLGVNNVVGEIAVKHLGGPNEYLGMLGFCAAIICAVQASIFEQDDVMDFFGKGEKAETCGKGIAFALLFGYIATSVLNYVGTAYFLEVSEATFLSLSVLTSDFWAVVFSVVAERMVPSPLFFVALVIIVGGFYVYEMGSTPVPENEEDVAINQYIRQESVATLPTIADDIE